jgi:uncharacterized protein YijF (DUF1287 family)
MMRSILTVVLLGFASCGQAQEKNPGERDAPSNSLVEAARAQVGKTTSYDSGYVALKYPGGDLPIEKGVCSDVVIRALRTGKNMDLQKLVHEDMKAHFSKYPTIWGLKRTDRNIDHRRVPNLKTFFKRKGYSLPVTKKKGDYLPGDLVTCTVPPNLPHIMVVSNRKSGQGVPLVIHNIGRGAGEEDTLFTYPLTGHYRVK